MSFDELLEQIIDLLQRQGRIPYGVLKRRFTLDDDYLQDLFVSLPSPALRIDMLQLRHQILLTTGIGLFGYSRSRNRLLPGGRRAGFCQLAL
jgi:hypothetical protein